MSPSEHKINQILELLRRVPGIHECIVGADDAAIDELERSLGKTLLPGHRTFLRHFGGCTKGRLNPFLYDSEFSLADIRAYYARETPFSYYTAPDEWTFVMTIGAMRLPYFLDHRSLDLHDPLIGRIDYDEDAERWLDYCEVYNPSFYGNLANEAFFAIRKSDQARSGASGWVRGEDVSNLVERMGQLGFERILDFDSVEFVFRHEDTFALLGPDRRNSHLEGLFDLSIHSTDHRRVRELEEILADNFEFTDTPKKLL